jgi:hypothetical protein
LYTCEHEATHARQRGSQRGVSVATLQVSGRGSASGPGAGHEAGKRPGAILIATHIKARITLQVSLVRINVSRVGAVCTRLSTSVGTVQAASL